MRIANRIIGKVGNQKLERIFHAGYDNRFGSGFKRDIFLLSQHGQFIGNGTDHFVKFDGNKGLFVGIGVKSCNNQELLHKTGCPVNTRMKSSKGLLTTFFRFGAFGQLNLKFECCQRGSKFVRGVRGKSLLRFKTLLQFGQ